jgi:hypothetical protein
MSLTYAQLSTAIQQYTEVTEATFVANIPNFVKNTEALVNNSVQLPAFRTNVTGVTTINFPYVALPLDFLSVFALSVYTTTVVDEVPQLTQTYLYQKDVEYIREAYPYPGVSGKPQYYGIFDNTSFILGPTPDAEYSVEMHYYAYPQSIVTANTSWLGNNFPNVLLWGSLVEAYIYMKGEADLIKIYQDKYQEALGLLKQLGDGKDRIDTYRVTQVRDKVV